MGTPFRGQFVLAALALLLAAACSRDRLSRTPSLKDYNLIVIVSDCLRADHVGAYGYHRDTTPNIDALAAGGLLFERAYSNSSYTRESVASLFTGVLPSTGGIRGMWAIPPAGRPALGELYSQAGYRTGFFTTSVIVWDTNFMRGFAENGCLAERHDQSRTSQALTSRALEFLDRHKDEKFFLYLHYLDPHGLYDPPEDAYRRFADEPHPEPVRILGDKRPAFSWLIPEDGFGPGEPRYEDMLARYDAEIWDMDRAVGRLIGGLRERGRFDDTVIVFTADHGEEFTEHGYMEHAWTLYQETIHVPLVIRAGGAFPPAQLAERVSLVALMPTLLEVMEVGGKGLNFDREPVLVRKNGGIAYAPSRRPIRSELLQAHRSVVRSVIDGDWKYLGASRWLHPPQRDELLGAGSLQEDLDAAATDGHFWGPVVHEELYNLREDPGERNNLVRQREDVRRRLAGRVEDHIGRTRPGPGDSPERPRKKLSEEQLERLRSLGYLR